MTDPLSALFGKPDSPLPPLFPPHEPDDDGMKRRATALGLASLMLPKNTDTGGRIVAADYLDRGYDAHCTCTDEEVS